MERDWGNLSAEAAASALAWWSDAGVDTIVAEAPRDWLAPKAPTAAPEARPAAPTPAPTPDAAMPAQLDLFRAWLNDNRDLPFAAPSAPRVLPSGDPAADLMILADMPSPADARAGTLMSGEAGRLFDRMLAAIGLERDRVYLASLSCLSAPGGRIDPAAAEACGRIARHHAGLVRPRALLMLGDACTRALTGLSVAHARGRWHDVETPAGPVRALATLRPEKLLAQPSLKKHAWEDLQLLMEGLKP